MEKEVKPVSNKQVPKKQNPKKQTEYYQLKKFSWEEFKKSIPPEMKPTALSAYIFLVLFVFAIIFSAFNFDFGSVMSGEGDVNVEVGWPFNLLELSAENPEKFPINIWGLLLDFLIYFAIAYPINVLWNVIEKKLAERKQKKYPLEIFKKSGKKV